MCQTFIFAWPTRFGGEEQRATLQCLYAQAAKHGSKHGLNTALKGDIAQRKHLCDIRDRLHRNEPNTELGQLANLGMLPDDAQRSSFQSYTTSNVLARALHAHMSKGWNFQSSDYRLQDKGVELGQGFKYIVYDPIGKTLEKKRSLPQVKPQGDGSSGYRG